MFRLTRSAVVAIAYLHHNDPAILHYQPEAWNCMRGAAATMDRDFGFIGHYLFHDVIEKHVLHHTVPTIPCYHARVMGKHYRSNTKDGPVGFFKSLWRTTRWCQWMDPCEGATGQENGVWFFRNSNHLGMPPLKNIEGRGNQLGM
jgi:omega-6 fatty acid desaturase (delta-12 desaturase)